MNGMSLHPYPKGAPTGCQISIDRPRNQVNRSQSSATLPHTNRHDSAHVAMVLPVKTSERYGKWFDFPCHYTNSNPHRVLRAIKVLKEDEKHIIVGFGHLQ